MEDERTLGNLCCAVQHSGAILLFAAVLGTFKQLFGLCVLIRNSSYAKQTPLGSLLVPPASLRTQSTKFVTKQNNPSAAIPSY